LQKVPATTDSRPSSAARSRTRISWLCASAALLVACARPTLLSEHHGEPREIQDACGRAELRCSSCHTLDRILSSHHRGRADWEDLVTQMRLKPGSGISVTEADAIVTCLTYVDTTRPRAGLVRSRDGAVVSAAPAATDDLVVGACVPPPR
jgi:hypothetical protein